LIDLLFKLGVTVSYDEIKGYERALVLTSPPCLIGDAYIQMCFDNFDLNIDTLNGKDTCHFLAGMTVISPASSLETDFPVLRHPNNTEEECNMIFTKPAFPSMDDVDVNIISVIVFDLIHLYNHNIFSHTSLKSAQLQKQIKLNQREELLMARNLLHRLDAPVA